jgi:hypothetical protein
MPAEEAQATATNPSVFAASDLRQVCAVGHCGA